MLYVRCARVVLLHTIPVVTVMQLFFTIKSKNRTKSFNSFALAVTGIKKLGGKASLAFLTIL